MVVPEFRVRRRRGAVMVETALVVVLLTSLVFGIFEYCRLLMDLNLLDNAAREGCRYALVNNTALTINSDVQGVVTRFMGSETANFSNPAVTATVTGNHNGVATGVNSLVPGDMITVTVTGNYQFMNIIPLIQMPAALPMSSSVTMGCEGGT